MERAEATSRHCHEDDHGMARPSTSWCCMRSGGYRVEPQAVNEKESNMRKNHATARCPSRYLFSWLYLSFATLVLMHLTAPDCRRSPGAGSLHNHPSRAAVQVLPSFLSEGRGGQPRQHSQPRSPGTLGAPAASGMEPQSPGAAQLLATAGSCPDSVKWGRKVTICSV